MKYEMFIVYQCIALLEHLPYRRKPTSPLRSAARPSLEGYSPEQEPRPTPAESIAEVRDDEVSSTCSEQPPTEALNGASSAGERGEKEKEEEEKPKEVEHGEPDLTSESTGPGTVLADSNPAEPKTTEEAPASSVVLENGDASDSQNAVADGSSSVSQYHIS